jgi:autotransporter adhesin
MGGHSLTGLANAALASSSSDAVTGAQLFATNQALSSLRSAQEDLTQLVLNNRSEYRAGIAAAMSMATPPMPSAPGKTSFIFKAASYEGEGAFGASFTHRFKKSDTYALTGGLSHDSGGRVGASIGFAGEF